MRNKKSAVKYRRKREGKTNYKKRLELLKSKTTRLVIRKSLKNFVAQMIEYKTKGDVVICQANSIELKKLGWEFEAKNMPSAYLIGLLLGKKAKEKNIKKAILDKGMQISIPKSKVYAAVKGVIDAGIEVPCSEDVFPVEERIRGEHITKYAAESKNPKQFSKVKEKGISELTNKFEDFKKKLKAE